MVKTLKEQAMMNINGNMKKAVLKEGNEKNENEKKNLMLETCSKCGTNKYKEIEKKKKKMLVKIQCPCEEAEQLEAFANFKMKVVSLLVSLGVKFFVLLATVTTTITVISSLKIIAGDVGGALTGIATLSLCLVIIFHIQTMVQVIINGRGLEGGAMEMVNNGASKLIKYLTGNFF